MNKEHENLPSIRSLQAFVYVAKLKNVTKAAEQMNTSQSAVSRHLRQLEENLGTTLIVKSGRGIDLTWAGKSYASDVSTVMQLLKDARYRLIDNRNELKIACTHEVSHLLLMPHYNALKQTVGHNAQIQLLTGEYNAIPSMIDTGVDIIFEYRQSRPENPSAVVLNEEIVPAAAPNIIEGVRRQLQTSSHHDGKCPLLSLTKENNGWATWDDWFEAQGHDIPSLQQEFYSNYVYALEAATRGEGIVLAWKGFADRYLENGQLVPADTRWLQKQTNLYAILTPNGFSKKIARKCLRFLASLFTTSQKIYTQNTRKPEF